MEAIVNQSAAGGNYKVTYTNAHKPNSVVQPSYYMEASSEFITRKLLPYAEDLVESATPFIRVRTHVPDDKFLKMLQLITRVAQWSKNDWPHISRLQQLFHAGSFEYLRDQLKRYVASNPMLPLENELDFYRAIHWIFLRFWEPFAIGEPTLVQQSIDISAAISGYTQAQLTEMVAEFSPILQDWDREIADRMAQFMRVVPTLVPVYTVQFYREFDKERDDILSSYGLSTARFEDIRGLYQDLFETTFRLSPLMVAHNNIIHRGALNMMPPGFGRTATIKDYSALRTGNKIEKLTQPKKPSEKLDELIELPLSTVIRNAIGHARWDYNPVLQQITYDTGANYLLEFALEIPRLLRTMLGLWELVYKVREWEYVSRGVLPSIDFSRRPKTLSTGNTAKKKGPKSKKSAEKQNRKRSRRARVKR